MVRKYKRTQREHKKKRNAKARSRRKKVGGATTIRRAITNGRPSDIPPRDYSARKHHLDELIRKLNTRRSTYCQYDKNRDKRRKTGEHGCDRRYPICMWGRKDGRGGERCMKNNDWLRYNTTRDSTLGIKGKYRLKEGYRDYPSNIGSSMGRVSSIGRSFDRDSGSSSDPERTILWKPGKMDPERTIHWNPDEETEDEEMEEMGDKDDSLQRLPPGLYLDPKREMERQERQRNADNAVNRIKEGYVGKPDGYTEPPKSYNY